MSPAKINAQVTHAVARAAGPICADFYGEANSVVAVVLRAKSEDKLHNLANKCKSYKVPYGLQVDRGINGVPAGTPTVLCVGPAPVADVDQIIGKLQL
jgi:PTH2 family peptidyl-tRNA hydrolase